MKIKFFEIIKTEDIFIFRLINAPWAKLEYYADKNRTRFIYGYIGYGKIADTLCFKIKI